MFSFSFEEKVMILATLRVLKLNKTVALVSASRRIPIAVARELISKLEKENYLTQFGVVEKTNLGTLRYVPFVTPQQPSALSTEYYNSCGASLRLEMDQAIEVLGCANMFKTIKPQPIAKRRLQVLP